MKKNVYLALFMVGLVMVGLFLNREQLFPKTFPSKNYLKLKAEADQRLEDVRAKIDESRTPAERRAAKEAELLDLQLEEARRRARKP